MKQIPLLICLLLLASCGGAQKSIERVHELERKYRNEADAKTDTDESRAMEFFGEYAKSLRGIDTVGCPPDFVEAWNEFLDSTDTYVKKYKEAKEVAIGFSGTGHAQADPMAAGGIGAIGAVMFDDARNAMNEASETVVDRIRELGRIARTHKASAPDWEKPEA